MIKSLATSPLLETGKNKAVDPVGTRFETPKVIPRSPSSNNETVSISYSGYEKLQADASAEAKTAASPSTDRFENTMNKLREHHASGGVTQISADPYENSLSIGIMALGGMKQLEKWEAQGMPISEESILAAGDAFNAGFKQRLDESGGTYSKKGLAINRHEIVKTNQDVPDWFLEEQQNLISQMAQNGTRAAFERGALFHVG